MASPRATARAAFDRAARMSCRRCGEFASTRSKRLCLTEQLNQRERSSRVPATAPVDPFATDRRTPAAQDRSSTWARQLLGREPLRVDRDADRPQIEADRAISALSGVLLRPLAQLREACERYSSVASPSADCKANRRRRRTRRRTAARVLCAANSAGTSAAAFCVTATLTPLFFSNAAASASHHGNGRCTTGRAIAACQRRSRHTGRRAQQAHPRRERAMFTEHLPWYRVDLAVPLLQNAACARRRCRIWRSRS